MKTLRRPNVLIIYTDQQRWDTLGCYGNSHAVTPHLDQFASEGARLDRYFVQNPVCMPSRMSFLTGQYCGMLGIGDNGIPFPDDKVPVHQLLKRYGYHTAQIGKLHFQPHSRRDHRDPADDYGFDTFILSDEPGCYDDAYTKWVEAVRPEMLQKIRTSLPPEAENDRLLNISGYTDIPRETHEPYVFEGEEDYTHSSFVASETCRFIKRHQDQPFFAIAGFYAPHTPVNPPKRCIDLYDFNQLGLPKLGEDEQFEDFLKDITAEQWQKIRGYYLALVSHVDDCVGQIMETLRQEGLEEETLVIFTSDHGEYLGDHGRIQKGMPGHDCIIRVPCMIKYPGKIKPGMVIDQFVEAVDIVPTILDFCGIQTPTFVQGQSVKGLLQQESDLHKEDILVESFTLYGNRMTAVRNKDYKYYCDSEGNEILYDLKNDPDELKNVAKEEQYFSALAGMRKRLIIRLQQAAYQNRNRVAMY